MSTKIPSPDVAPLGAARRAGYPPRLVDLITQARLERRRHQHWNEIDDGAQDVPDLTGGAWPSSCDARWRPAGVVAASGDSTWPGFICTRRVHHTCRHAAAGSGLVVAVWGDP